MMEVISLGVAITALIGSCGAAFWAGRVDARLNNGLSETIKETRHDVRDIHQKLDDLPCKVNTERLNRLVAEHSD